MQIIRLSRKHLLEIGKKAGWIVEAEGGFRPVLRAPGTFSSPVGIPSVPSGTNFAPVIRSEPVHNNPNGIVPPKVTPKATDDELSKMKLENAQLVQAYVKNYIYAKSLEKEQARIEAEKKKTTNIIRLTSLNIEYDRNSKLIAKLNESLRDLRNRIKVSLMDDADWALLKQYGARI